MSGDRYLLDTNALVALLQGNMPLSELLADASWVGISVISQLEFLSFPNLSEDDRQLFGLFAERVDIAGLTPLETPLLELIVELRARERLRLPDAIIAATALHTNATLVTADARLLRVGGVSARSF